MKQKLTLLAILMMALAIPQKAFAYQFTAVAPSGQMLYFNIVDSHAVVTYPGSSSYPYNDLSLQPVGDLVIPSTVFRSNIPYTVTAIGESAFSGCNGLTSVTIPNTITSIGKSAFYACNGLDSVTIPNSVTTIGERAFNACQNLQSVVIPNSVETIGVSAFNTCISLISINIPNSVTNIGNSAFANCSSLPSIIIPNSITRINSNTFYFCTSLVSVDIPGSVTRINASAFAGCSSLASVIIPNSVTYIGNNAFNLCSGLTSVTIGASVDTIGNAAFENCSSLTEITIPNSVTRIGNQAFRYCESLSVVTIGNSVTSIGGYAFGYWNDLTIYCKPLVPPALGSTAFTGGSGQLNVYVQCGSVSDYQAASNWSAIRTRIFGTQFLEYTTVFAANNDDMGQVVVGVPDCDSNVALTAIVDSGYRFVGWSDGVADESRIVHLSSDTTIIAIFDYFVYAMTGLSSDTNRGTVTGSDTVYIDTQVTLNAVPKYGYHFTHWSDGNTSATRTVTVTCDSVLVAYFEINSYTLSLQAVGADCGIVTGAGTYYYLDTVAIAATANPHFHFKYWSDGVTQSSRSIVITADISLAAIFAIDTHLVSVMVSNPEKGMATGGGYYTYGSTVEITATDNYGYHFCHWSDGDTSASRSIMVVGDNTLTAFFDANSYTISLQSTGEGYGTVSGAGVYYYMDTVEVSATANPHYHFKYWSDGVTDNPRMVVMTADISLAAIFAVDTHTVTVVSGDLESGEVSGSGQFIYGSYATITATPYCSRQFIGWSDGSTSNPYTFIVDKDTTLTASFAPYYDTIHIHDTAYINVPVHDTFYVYVPYDVHDTTYINIHDTTVVVDTLTMTEYVTVHDTTIVTVTETVFDTVVNTVYDTVDNFIYDTTVVTDTLWLTQTDTVWMHDTIIIHDTVYVTQEGIDGVDGLNAKVYSSQGQIVVDGADGNTVTLFDINGRVLATKRDHYAALRFDAPASGTYLIRIGGYPAHRIVVIR